MVILTGNVAYDGWTTSTVVTDGLDDLNQVSLNIANSTFVGQASFTGTPTAGPSPQTVSFTGTFIGNANGFEWNFGDGNTAVHTQNPSHTYIFKCWWRNIYCNAFTAKNHRWNLCRKHKPQVQKDLQIVQQEQIILHCYTPTPAPSFTIN